MTAIRSSLFALGVIVAFGLGMAVGPTLMDRQAAVTTPAAEATPQPAAAPAAPARAVRTAATREAAAVSKAIAAVPASAPDVQVRLKPVLNRGADMTLAAEGFANAEQFAAVAYAARNTEVPFMLLKHRVIEEGKSLEAAIRESKPDINAAIEAERARAEARSEIAALTS